MVFDKDKGTSNIALLKTQTSLYVFFDSETFLNRVISVILYSPYYNNIYYGII